MKQMQELLRSNMDSTSDAGFASKEEEERFKADSYNRTPGTAHDKSIYDCKICLNKGDIAIVRQNDLGWWTIFHRPCKCLKIRSTIRRMQRSGLKDIIRDYTFDKYKADEPWQQAIKQAAMDYAKDPRGWFFIGGQSGAGKTHICTAICREFLLEGREVKYMLWRDDVTAIKQAVNDYELYKQLIGQYKDVDVLYIDDLFKIGKTDGHSQKPTTGDINAAFEILNGRYNDPRKITIISSECTVNDILDIDEAVAGRIFERAKPLNLKPDRSKNYRLKGAVDL